MAEIIFLIVILLVLLVGLPAIFWFLNNSLKKREEGLIKKVDDSSGRQVIELRRELNERLKEDRESFERTTQNMHRKFSDFEIGVTKMDEALKQLDDSVKEVSSFQQIFRTPKLRGRWGELSLEHILSQYFPRDMFKLQYLFKSGEAVDAILKLPNGKLLPIDSKFPQDHFENMIKSDNENEREIAKKLFATEIKKEIDDIAKKYILPSEETMDVACMYIPAEAVYFEVISSLSEVLDYAHTKRVFLTSPNTFHLMLQVVQQWAHDMQIGRKTKDIIQRMNKIINDAKKLDESFNKLGKHLRDASSSYEESDRRLGFLKEKAEKLMELETKEAKQLEGPKEEDEADLE